MRVCVCACVALCACVRVCVCVCYRLPASWAQFLASAILAATGEDGPELNNKHICGISIGVLFVWSLLNLARIDGDQVPHLKSRRARARRVS